MRSNGSLRFDEYRRRWLRALAGSCTLALAACSSTPSAPSGSSGSVAPAPATAGSSGNTSAPTPTAGSAAPTAGSQAQPQPQPSMDAGPPPGSAGSASPMPDAQVVQPVAGSQAPADAGAGPVLPPVSDPGATGPFTVQRMETIPGLDTHGLIIPVELGREGVKHPILVWINGASAGFSSYRNMLDNVASHGFFIISDKQSTFSAEPEVTAQKAAIDWAVMQAETAGGPYYGKIDPTRIAIGGHSMGSVASFGNVKDPRVKTSIHMAGGLVGNPEGVDETWIDGLHAPAAFLCGERDTNGIGRVRNDFQAIPAGVPVFFGLLAGVGHTDEFSQPNGGRWGRVVIAWLRWQLADDASYAASFMGPSCMFCTGDWTAMKQAID